VSKPKPWDILCDHPYRDEYYKYLNYTPYYGYKAPKVLTTFLKHPKIFNTWLKEQIKKIIYGNPYLQIKQLS